MSKVAVPPYGGVYTVGRMSQEIKQVFNSAIVFYFTFVVYTNELCLRTVVEAELSMLLRSFD